MRFPSFSDQIIKKASTGPCKESPGIPPRFYQGIPLRVMVRDDLMALVLRTKSIGQGPFTLVDRTL